MRRRQQEPKGEVADSDDVRVFEFASSLDRRFIDVRAIAAAQIFDEEVAMHVHDLRVVAADGGVLQNDLAMRMPAKHGAFGLHLDELAGSFPLEDFQDSHDEINSSMSEI